MAFTRNYSKHSIHSHTAFPNKALFKRIHRKGAQISMRPYHPNPTHHHIRNLKHETEAYQVVCEEWSPFVVVYCVFQLTVAILEVYIIFF